MRSTNAFFLLYLFIYVECWRQWWTLLS